MNQKFDPYDPDNFLRALMAALFIFAVASGAIYLIDTTIRSWTGWSPLTCLLIAALPGLSLGGSMAFLLVVVARPLKITI